MSEDEHTLNDHITSDHITSDHITSDSITDEPQRQRHDNQTLEPSLRNPHEAEIASLAIKLAEVYRNAIDYFRQQHGLAPTEAVERAGELLSSVGETGVSEPVHDAIIYGPPQL